MESEKLALITRYSDNHCLVTRYPDAYYLLCKTNPVLSAVEWANFQKSEMNATPFNATDYENKSNWTLGENKPKQTQFH